MTWSPTPNRILAVAALILFILAALAFGGIVEAGGLFLLACGAACLAGAGVF